MEGSPAEKKTRKRKRRQHKFPELQPIRDFPLPAAPARWREVLVHINNPILQVQWRNPSLEIQDWQIGKRHRNRKYASQQYYTSQYKRWEAELVALIKRVAPSIPFAALENPRPALDGKGIQWFKVPSGGCGLCRNAFLLSNKARQEQRAKQPEKARKRKGSPEGRKLSHNPPLAFYPCQCTKKRMLYCLRCVIRSYLLAARETQGRVLVPQEETGLALIRCNRCGHGWNLSCLTTVQDPHGTPVDSLSE